MTSWFDLFLSLVLLIINDKPTDNLKLDLNVIKQLYFNHHFLINFDQII